MRYDSFTYPSNEIEVLRISLRTSGGRLAYTLGLGTKACNLGTGVVAWLCRGAVVLSGMTAAPTEFIKPLLSIVSCVMLSAGWKVERIIVSQSEDAYYL
jgi:hypothetical protein